MSTPEQPRALPSTSAFAGDDGTAPPALADALAEPDPQQRLAAVVTALPGVRVLVPVIARLDERAEPGEHGVAGEKSAHAAMVTVAIPDGRAAVPVFSSVTAMRAWRPDARPVPVEGRRAALAAGTEADGVLVLDPGGERAVQVPRPAVRAVALGEPWVPAVRNEVLQREVWEVLTALPEVRATTIEPGRTTEICVVAHLRRHPSGLPDPATTEALRRCREALAASAVVVDLVDSLAVRPAITH